MALVLLRLSGLGSRVYRSHQYCVARAACVCIRVIVFSREQCSTEAQCVTTWRTAVAGATCCVPSVDGRHG
eukprot:2721479-Prymnesium_polylepis.2